MYPFNRFSFTIRLVLVALTAAIGPIVIAYIALLGLPARVAGDSLELALRETSQEVVSAIREDRLRLREEVAELGTDRQVQQAILQHDADLLAGKLAVISPDLRLVFLDGARPASSGPVSAPLTVAGNGDRSVTVVIYRVLDSKALNELAANVSVPIAVTNRGTVIARSKGVPRDLNFDRLRDITTAKGPSEIGEVRYENETLHVFSRPVGNDTTHHVVALSTPQIEQDALAAPRNDIARTLAFLVLAAAVFAIAGSAAVNRSIKNFTRQTRRLAGGDYAVRLPVRGSDSFAALASSFNLLATELEQRILQLEEAAHRYERTLQTLEEGICVWSEHGALEFCNAGAERMTGVTHAQLLADPDDELRKLLASEHAPGSRRLTLPTVKGGGRLVVELQVTPMPDGGIVQTFRDVTTLEMLHQTRRNFMATAAHQLRTPLTTILGFSQTLSRSGIELTDEQRDEFMGLIHEQAEHLQRLTDAFFTNHQLANERVEVSLDTVSLLDAVVAGMAKADLDPIDADFPAPSPEVDVNPELQVIADPRALAGVVAILVDNARKYGNGSIKIAAHTNGDRVLLAVHDDGAGIEPRHLERLFDPFYRVDVDMRSGVGGAGLGLFTARKLVAAMRGVISIKSSPGQGTTLEIDLPLANRA